MDSSLIVVGNEAQLRGWAWGPVLDYAPIGKTVSLRDRFANCALADYSMFIVSEEKAVSLLRKAAAGIFILSDHTVRDFNVNNGKDMWDRVPARIGFTGLEVFTAKGAHNSLQAAKQAILTRLTAAS